MTEDGALRALQALSKALEKEDRSMWYTSGNDVAMTALTAIQKAVDQAISQIEAGGN